MNPTFFAQNNTIVAIAGGESSGGANTLAYTVVNNDEPNVSFTRASSQFMSAPSTTYNIQTNGGFTAVARVRFMNTLVDERVFDFGPTGGATSDLISLTRGAGGTYFQAWIMNSTAFTGTLAGGTIVQNQWTNLVMRYTLSTNTFQLYQNGTLVASQTVASPLTNRTLGLNYIGYNIANNLYSSIDYAGLFVYDRALSDSEIALCLDYIQGRQVYTPIQNIVINSGTNQGFDLYFYDSPNDLFNVTVTTIVFPAGTYTPSQLATSLTAFMSTNPPGAPLNQVQCTWNPATGRFSLTFVDGFYVKWIGFDFINPTSLPDLMGFQVTSYPQQKTITAPNPPTTITDSKFALIARTLGLADGANVATWGGFTQATSANQPVFWRRFNNWVGLGNSPFSTFPHDFKYARNRWVAVGVGTNTLAYSNDGITWTPVSGIFSSAGVGVGSSSTLWVAGGSGTTNSMAYSADGISWTGLGKTVLDSCFQTAWNPKLNRWVAVGDYPATNQRSIAYSPDGQNWTIATSPFTSIGNYSAAYCVATAILPGGGTRWVVGGQNNPANTSLAYSTDGITWTGNGNSIFSSYCFGVAWNGSLWVAVGSGSANSIATSPDGVGWTARGKPAGINTGRRVAWTGTYWIVAGEPAGGGNCLAISYDGVTWTGITRQGLFTTRALSVGSNFSVL